jgi:hypothetical protein
VQVDHVRHHGRPEDAGGKQDAPAAVEGGDEAVGGSTNVEADPERVVEEAERDDAEQEHHCPLEAPTAARLETEDGEGGDRGDCAGREQRDSEQQVERDRRPDELGQVGGHSDQLGLQPQAPRHPSGKSIAADLGEAPAGGDAELRAQMLHEHRHQVCREDHPKQQVTVLGAALDVGGEVAGIDVGDTGHERRAEQRGDPAHPAPNPHARATLGIGQSYAARLNAQRAAGTSGSARISARVRWYPRKRSASASTDSPRDRTGAGRSHRGQHGSGGSAQKTEPHSHLTIITDATLAHGERSYVSRMRRR